MKLRRRPFPEAEVPTASMPDVAFLLVIFFMVTATFAAQRGLGLTLPSNEQTQDTTLDTREAVQLHVWTDHAELNCSPVDAGEARSRLRSILTDEPGLPVVLVVEPQADYEHMVQYYDVLTELRAEGLLEEIHLPSNRDRESYRRHWGVDPYLAACR